jgi:UDP-glucose:(heptosyl)LPS alpha-1,3-glucosyltransferase
MKQPRPAQVALIHPHYRPDGGAERAIVHIVDALGPKDIHITIISRHWAARDEHIEVLRCNPFYLGRLWREWSFARAAEKIVARMQFDIVQSQVRLSGCDIYRAGGGVHREWLKQRNRASHSLRKLFVRFSLYNGFKLRAEKNLYANPRLKAVICNSRMVKEEIEHYFKIPCDKMHVFYNPVDLEKFDRQNRLVDRRMLRGMLGLGSEGLVYLFVGSGFERKGLSILLESMAHLPEDTSLLVVGKESRMGKYQRKCRRLGITDRVIFAGMQKDVAPYYAAADVFVLPTLYDPFANSVLEAMAASLPVITSFKCGAVDIIQNGRNGFVCDALDKGALVRYMRLLRNKDLRMSVGIAGRETVSTFTLDAMSRNLRELYETILD